jgi:hypothetical protein
MQSCVGDIWLDFNLKLEGRVPFMYLDLRGYLSVGIGDIIDAAAVGLAAPTEEERTASLDLAFKLRWLRTDGSPAEAAEIADEWDRTKGRTDLAARGPGAFRPPVTSLHVDAAVADRFALGRLSNMELALTSREAFAAFDSWPADAQLGLLSIAFKWGTDFQHPLLEQHLAAGDFGAAAEVSVLNPNIGSYILRNERNAKLFNNAAVVAGEGRDFSQLVYPEAAGVAGDPPETESKDGTFDPPIPNPTRPDEPDNLRSAPWHIH